jgi:hypothetical protein
MARGSPGPPKTRRAGGTRTGYPEAMNSSDRSLNRLFIKFTVYNPFFRHKFMINVCSKKKSSRHCFRLRFLRCHFLNFRFLYLPSCTLSFCCWTIHDTNCHRLLEGPVTLRPTVGLGRSMNVSVNGAVDAVRQYVRY